jgi:hypothetical protein
MIGRRGTIGGDKDKPIEQVVYYQTGVGTGPTTGLTGKAANLVQGREILQFRLSVADAQQRNDR